MDIEAELWKVDFAVGKSMRYHMYRRAWWDNVDHWNQVFVLVTGAAVVISLLKAWTAAEIIVAVLVAVLSALDIVFKFAERARQHDSLYRDYSSLAQEIAATITPTPELIAKWRARRIAIEGEEPTINARLDLKCRREEAIARGADPDRTAP